MGHPDQHTPDDHRSSKRDSAPEPQLDETIKEDLDPAERAKLDERASTGSNVRADEPDETMKAEFGHTYVGRQMSDDLKANPRPRSEEEATGQDDAD
jgi:hypothetical protein